MGKDIRSMALTSSVVGAVWFFIILMVILGNVINRGQNVHYEAPTPVCSFFSPLTVPNHLGAVLRGCLVLVLDQ